MRSLLLLAVVSSTALGAFVGCGGNLGPRAPLTEEPIGTTTSSGLRSASDDAEGSKGGMVAAKIEDGGEAKKTSSPAQSAPAPAKKPAARRPSKRR